MRSQKWNVFAFLEKKSKERSETGGVIMIKILKVLEAFSEG